jgi:hypothetical protein
LTRKFGAKIAVFKVEPILSAFEGLEQKSLLEEMEHFLRQGTNVKIFLKYFRRKMA